MGAAAVAMGGVQAGMAYGQYQTQLAESNYQFTMSKINARNAELQAKKAKELGDEKASDLLKQTSSLVGAQKTAFAAGGVDISFGTAKEVFQQTYEAGYKDAETIRTNAFLEGLGYQSQAQEFLRVGDLNQAVSQSTANQTLLTGLMRAGQTAYGNSGSSSQNSRG